MDNSELSKSTAESETLITLLQEFIDESTSEQSNSDESLQSDSSDEGNNPLIPQLKNPKRRQGRGRPSGTKRFKSSQEVSKPKSIYVFGSK
ncbi:9199_t:CDS:2 [Dentiscutata erythropus]|uniref:9199_t:CDS:1 n=1 Tax=Dentiscutata erythropus TaxID=1348616 RepID=A0A9N9FY48_9GLOM|nr:9199_t:CDS:2 [Dentiscutata erythropus]